VVDSTQALPGAAYADPAFFARDRAEVFWPSWLCVAHESELVEAGAYVAVELFGERLLVVRDGAGALTGLVDRCLHRGTPLTDGAGGHLDGCELACPYHGLRYDLRGCVIDTSAAGFALAERELPRLAVATWRGFVLVRPGKGAPLEAFMGRVPPWLARAELAALRLGRRQRYEVGANWKLCVENFQESHHFPHVHPGLEQATPWRRSHSVDLGGAWLGGVMPIEEGRETVSDGRLRDGRAFVAAAEDRHAVHDAMLFPAWLTSLQPDYFLSYRLWPQAPDRTLVVADIFFHGDDAARDASAVYAFWDRTNDEDQRICERQQRGVSAPSYRPGRYAESEDGMRAFDERVAERYAPAAAPRRAPIVGIFGKPFAALDHLVDDAALAAIDREITTGLARVETSQTGGSLKWMGVVAPWCMDDGFRDYMQVIEAFDDDDFREFVALADDPSLFAEGRRGDYAFGDETDHPLNREQMRYLAFRHGVYFPWKVCYHLLENDRWEDKHSGAGKEFGEEAQEMFPRTIELIRALPFREMGRVVIFGLMPNDHAPLHRDSEPGRALAVAQSITIDPRGTKRFYLQNAEDDAPLIVDARVYWFNDMDYHGVLADPFFRYSLRIDGVFEDGFVRDLERSLRRAHGALVSGGRSETA
jgi:Rieske 2Fe-2S family protein